MGEARNRGNYEQRKSEAIKRNKIVTAIDKAFIKAKAERIMDILRGK